ncbi:hypothetical protein G4B88_009922 [Cannabis sativa]|uniref:Pentatricopeptide repeat-containing protein n=1 Tax=Cannabis sativa TaxID=3483 RepID=A0A7J6DNN7_CANSA|nr:hypothetical protein G4B88_009922 [Cannabis sativa]
MSLYMPLFRSCTTIRTLVQLHAHLFVSGLHKDPQASTKLIQSYAQMGSLQSSKQVFQTFPNPDFFMWGVLIKCYVWNHLFKEAIALYHKMLYLRIHVNRFIFPSVLRAFSSFGDVDCGGKLHGRAIKCGFDNDGIVQTSLLLMYGDFGCLDNARKVFDAMSVRDLVAWSAMIESCVENGMANEALDLFCWMVFEGVNPDSVTMLSVVDACGDLRSSRLVKSVHGYIVRRNMKTDGSLDSSLITMYGKCGDLHGAEILFRNVTHPTTSSWTAMLSCYNQSGCFYKAIDIFVKMQLMIVEPNSVTMMSVLRSCANLGLLKEGKSIHCFAIRKAVDFDILKPTLLELYADCRRLSDCEKILLTTGEKNIVQWNTLISILARKGLLEEALLVFKQMITEGLMPDSYSLASSLSACGNVGQLHLGHQIHSHILKRSYFDEFVQNSLIDMYCKCGIMDSSYKNGYSYEAISLFDQMYFDRLQMNEVTFLLVIQACSESGYLEKGKWLHHKLITCGMNQDTYIGTALTDMYAKCGDLKTARRVFDSISERSIVSWSVMIAGRAGDLYGAYGVIKSMPVFVEASIWSSLLNGCRIHQRMDMLNNIQKDISDISSDDPGYYTLLSNIYAEEGNWDEFGKVRSRMKHIGLKKIPGYSTIELENRTYRFGAGDVPHPDIKEICKSGSDLTPPSSSSSPLIHDYSSHSEDVKCIIKAKETKVTLNQQILKKERRNKSMKKLGFALCLNIFNLNNGGVFQRRTLTNSTYSELPQFSQTIASVQSIFSNPYFSLLGICRNIDSLKKIHALLILNGLTEDIICNNKLVSLYGSFGYIRYARQLFNQMPNPDFYSWKAMLRWYFLNEFYFEVLRFHNHMRPRVKENDNIVFSIVLKACSELRNVEEGRKVHCLIEKAGNPDSFVLTGLVDMYARCGWIENSRAVFDGILDRNVVSWTTMIVGYVQNDCAKEGLALFNRMREGFVECNEVTLGSLIKACTKIGSLHQGKWFHGYVSKSGFELNYVLGTALLDMYVKCDSIGDARCVFDELSTVDLVSWTAMIVGYCQTGHPDKALNLFTNSKWVGFQPNSITTASLLSSCAQLSNLSLGMAIHGLGVKLGLEDSIVRNALVDMYAKCHMLGDARYVFEMVLDKNVIAWNSIISGYSQNRYAYKALQMFHRMRSESFVPDAITLVSVLSACAFLGYLRVGSSLHAYSIKRGLMTNNVVVGTALLNFYAKSGDTESARIVFDGMEEKNSITWSTMVDGYGIQGDNNECFTLFDEMLKNDIQPDEETFTTILSACSHSGKVQEGWRYFNLMCQHYKFVPSMKHYTCMVDMLARDGKLEEAMEFIKNLPVQPDVSLLGAFLHGCEFYSRLDLGEIVIRKMLELNPQKACYYVLMSNLYASVGRWSEVNQVREMLKERGFSKCPASSMVEMNNDISVARVACFA